MKVVKKIVNSKAYAGEGTIYPGKGGSIYFKITDTKSALRLNKMLEKEFDYMDDYPLSQYGGGGADSNVHFESGDAKAYVSLEWKVDHAIPADVVSFLKKKGFKVK
jgi:hypothetical protein